MCSHLVSVCRGNVVVLCSQVGCCYNEVHVEVGIIILLNTGHDTITKTGLPSLQSEAVLRTKHTSGEYLGLEIIEKILCTFSKSMALSLNWKDSGEGSWTFSSSNLESSVYKQVNKSH